MSFSIRMGIPEMRDLWNYLQCGFNNGSLCNDDLLLYKKWGKALKFLSENPRHSSLKSHEIDQLTKRYGMKVWQSYLENRTSGAMRMFWVYGPNTGDITIIGLEPHPDNKNGSYDRVTLSWL